MANFGNSIDDLSMPEELRNTYKQIHYQINQLFFITPIQSIWVQDQLKLQNQMVAARLHYLEQKYLAPQSELNNISDPFYTPLHTENPMLVTTSSATEITFPIQDSGIDQMEYNIFSADNYHGDVETVFSSYNPSSPRPTNSKPQDQISAKLAQKVADIASPACLSFARDYAGTIHPPDKKFLAAVSKPSSFPSFCDGDGGSAFLQSLLTLGQTIEKMHFGEQHCRIWKRIALAHFYKSYANAQANGIAFLAWYRGQQSTSMALRGQTKALVSRCFVNLLFPSMNGELTGGELVDEESTDRYKAKLTKIQTWRKYGKPWAHLIDAFGYGILLLVPTTLTDEDLRVASELEISLIISNINNRMEDIHTTLETLNESFKAFFPCNN